MISVSLLYKLRGATTFPPLVPTDYAFANGIAISTRRLFTNTEKNVCSADLNAIRTYVSIRSVRTAAEAGRCEPVKTISKKLSIFVFIFFLRSTVHQQVVRRATPARRLARALSRPPISRRQFLHQTIAVVRRESTRAIRLGQPSPSSQSYRMRV